MGVVVVVGSSRVRASSKIVEIVAMARQASTLPWKQDKGCEYDFKWLTKYICQLNTSRGVDGVAQGTPPPPSTPFSFRPAYSFFPFHGLSILPFGYVAFYKFTERPQKSAIVIAVQSIVRCTDFSF